jgi:hypothetical protein
MDVHISKFVNLKANITNKRKNVLINIMNSVFS